MHKLAAFLIILIITSGTYALDDKSYAHGWYWANEPVVNTNTSGKDVAPNTKRQVITNSMIVDEISKKVNEAKAKAILHPSVENTADYIRMQNKVVSMATDFSLNWEKALLRYPELDYTVANPTNNYVVNLIKQERKIAIKNSVEKFSKSYGIIFFFKGDDNLSFYQSEILKDFSQGNAISIIPVSLDNKSNKYFPNARLDSSRAQELGIKSVPAMIALNVRTNKAYPLAYSIKTKLEIEESIYTLLEGNLNDNDK